MSAVPASLPQITPGCRPHAFFGVPIHPLRMREMVALAQDAIESRRLLRVGVVNAAKIVNMQRDRLLREAVLDSEAIVADGMSIVWASRLLGHPLPERVAGIDLMLELLTRGSALRWRAYLLGATGEVVSAVTEYVRTHFPGVDVVGHRDGYYLPNEEPQVALEIQQSRADLLLVAMSPPKKELFLGRWARELGVPVCHGVGGAFDVLAGRVKRAPLLWQRAGMEWFYRLLQEPRRLWKRYLSTNLRFMWLVAREFFGRPARARSF